jgi:Flp pilus assembly protein TadG
MIRQTPRRSKYGQRGSVALEYGLIAPLLLVVVLGTIDTGRLIWNYTTLYRATEAAARCGAVNTIRCATAPQIQTYAVAEAWGMTVDPSVFIVTTPSCGLQVRATYNFTSIVPGFDLVAPMGLITLQATACFPM